MPIREFFHLIHIVQDENEVDDLYERLFACQYLGPRRSWMEGEKRWASLAMVSDLMIEVIEPSGKPEDLQMPLSKFRERFGQHFHSLAWYVDSGDIKPLFDRLRDRGVRIAKPGGGIFPGGDVDPGNTLFTHPKDTFGQIEFEGLHDTWQRVDPRFQEAWTTEPWRGGPLGIERLSHMTTIVRDLAAARALYEDAFEGTVFHQETTTETESLFAMVGTDTVIELAKPLTKDSRMATDLATNGEMPHSATFKVSDLDAVERHASSLGLSVAERTSDTLILDPADTFNAVWAFTTRELPGDPRGS
jgi:catechol 2,3-dioxygenase-like lactoylglutathione lyase family enzyme